MEVEMVTPKIVSMQEIDNWPLDQSGLRPRIVNAGRSTGLRTAGELRALSPSRLLAIGNLGRVSLYQVKEFFALAERIAAGKQVFKNLDDMLRFFLDRDQFEVIYLRFALEAPGAGKVVEPLTLQAIGKASNRTRERIRQIEAAALQYLAQRMPQICLDPVYQHCEKLLHQSNATAGAEELAERMDLSLLGPLNGAGVLRLLSRCNPNRLTYYGGIASLWSSTRLQTLENEINRQLQRTGDPAAIDKWISKQPSDVRKTAEVLIRFKGLVRGKPGRHRDAYD